ncbi:MAG: hypothetical protein QM737_00910 [Ferruginibacter sp.]
MKHISCIIFFFAFLINSSAQKTDSWPDTKKMNLQGTVSSLQEISYYCKDGSYKIIPANTDSIQPNCSYYFNRKGNIDSIANYNIAGKISFIEIFGYNDKELLVQKNEIDTNRKLISAQNIQYDKNNYRAKEIYKNSIGEMFQQKIYKYSISDSNNYSYSVTAMGANNALQNEVIFRFRYSPANNLIYKITEYPRNKATATRVKFYYDSSNQVIHKTVETIARKKIESEQFMEYDNKGNVTKFIETMPRNNIVYSYEYDSRGNWTKRATKAFVTDKTNGKTTMLYTITLREYKYY